MEIWQIITGFVGIFISSSAVTTLITTWINRRKTGVEVNRLEAEIISLRTNTESAITNMALKVMSETLDNTINPLNKRIDQLESENAELKEAIENLNGKFLKLQLAFSVVTSQLRQSGQRPLVNMMDLDDMSVDELRDIIEGMINVERRRQWKK